MRTRRIGPTVNRSVVGVTTEFTFLANAHRDQNRLVDLGELAARLASTPCSPLRHTHIRPSRAFTALVESMSQ